MKWNSFFVFIHPFDEGWHSAAAVADLAGEFRAFAIEEDDGWEPLDFVFLGEGLVGGFLFLGLLGTAGEVEFHGDEVRAREFLEGGLGKDISGLFFAGWAPVGTGEFEEHHAVPGSGFFEGFVVVRAPEVGGLEGEGSEEEKGEYGVFHRKMMDGTADESRAKLNQGRGNVLILGSTLGAGGELVGGVGLEVE